MIIFDSLSHPTIDNTWNNMDVGNSFKNLIKQMNEAGIDFACAVGLHKIGSFDLEKYYQMASATEFKNRLIPIAGFNPKEYKNARELEVNLREIKKIGYKGIKIHPRYSSINLDIDKRILIETFNIASDLKIPVFLCSYYHTQANKFPTKEPLISLAQIFKETPDCKIILLHGGGVRVLEYMEFVRFNENILLDLSLTLMKYAGSSIDIDLKYLFNNFDRRICIGSDHPEWELKDFKRKVSDLCKGLPKHKVNNLTYLNLSSFLNINLDPTS